MGVEKEDSDSKFTPKIYVITAAQAIQSEEHADKMPWGADSSRGAPNQNFLRALEKYCDKRGAELEILSMSGMDNTETELHPQILKMGEKENVQILYSMWEKERQLNNNIKISGMVEPPQNMDIPTTRDRFIQKDQSVVMAFTKQRLRCVPTGNSRFPKLIAGTGVCTFPNYNIDESMAVGNRRADIALRDHTFGAVVVEVVSPKNYNLRHLPVQLNGKFVDLGRKFDEDGKSPRVGVEALVLGDLHVGSLDELTMQANYEMIGFFKPKRLVLHDLADSESINPYEKDDYILRAVKAKLGMLDLEKELKEINKVLWELSKAVGRDKEILVTHSNHDNFIYRYVAEGNFPRDSTNAEIGSYLFEHVVRESVRRRNPYEAVNLMIEEGIKRVGKIPSNVKFLKLGEDYRVWGYQLANHGHKGHSGGRGSTTSQELMSGKTITGHTHSPELLRNAVVVGTSSRLDMGYKIGEGSKWMAGNAVLYDQGLVQLIPIINGKWKMASEKIR